jgi:hypothetical protein
MVDWAADRVDAGHLPFDGWFPDLSLGSSKFHRYQSLPHIATGTITAWSGVWVFPWTLYLLLALWPIAVYASARLFGLEPWVAAAAAFCSPLVVSEPGLGYEVGTYTWRGSGVWTQLWGMWALPFAWALGWRAIVRDRSLALAAGAVALTVCLHLLTGYLAIGALGVFVLTGGVWSVRALGRRVVRAALVAGGAFAASAWMLVPLLTDRSWTTLDRFSRGTIYYDSFGARKVLTWLVTGQLFDRGRWVSVVTILVAIGVSVAFARWRGWEAGRAIVGVGALSLVLFFGRPTLGPVLDLLPGSSDLFLRRYVLGVHLAGIWLAGVGGVWLARATVTAVGRARARGRGRPALALAATSLAATAILAVALLPAFGDRWMFHAQGRRWMAEQRIVDATEGAAFASLVTQASAEGAGRAYAGSRSRSGTSTDIGQVPSYIALLNARGDGIGFTRPTWSLVSNVEAGFDPGVEGQWDVMGIRYAVLREGVRPSPPAVEVRRAGGWALWRVDGTGYLKVVDTQGILRADRTNLSQRVADWMVSGLPARSIHPTIGFAGRVPATPTLPADAPPPALPPGSIVSSDVRLDDGWFAATVDVRRRAVVTAKAAFDPRFAAWVDGRPAPVQMVAPGFPGVVVEPGRHAVLFAYRPYPGYGWLFAIGVAALGGLASADRRRGRQVNGCGRADDATPKGHGPEGETSSGPADPTLTAG